MGQQQRDASDYLREENQVLREQLGAKRLRLNDDQRRRLAAKAKMTGRYAKLARHHIVKTGNTEREMWTLLGASDENAQSGNR